MQIDLFIYGVILYFDEFPLLSGLLIYSDMSSVWWQSDTRVSKASIWFPFDSILIESEHHNEGSFIQVARNWSPNHELIIQWTIKGQVQK